MDRNAENNYGVVANIEKPRSNWNRSYNHKTTFNNGDLVPFYFDMDIIPGTTIKNKTNIVIRLATPLYPTMDNMYLDTYWFKCSKFWYWDHFRRMMGENDYGSWTQTIVYSEPKITTDGTETAGDLCTYLGVRQKTAGQKYSKMAINCYCDVWNQWFRDQNLQAPIIIDKTDTNLTADGTIQTGFGLLKVAKYHDYFSSCLPQPQKSDPISTPLGTSAPLVADGVMKWKFTDGTSMGTGTNSGVMRASGSAIATAGTSISTNVSPYHLVTLQYSGAELTNYQGKTISYDSGLSVDLTNAVAATINAQRLAFATQRILERDSMGGTRYRELLRNHYGSSPDDESMLCPEYLGGHRQPINITQVLQNSATDETSPLGQTGAMSLTIDSNEDFTKSFTKDDILIGLLCVRADHSYQQGLPRQLTRTTRLDRYWPEFAHIGNQPVYNYEIFVQGNDTDNEVFGYKEAWQEYMYKNNMITGELNSDFAQSLDVWHYGDDYSTLPVLSDEWIKEPVEFVDRTLAVQSSTHHQFIADIEVTQNVTAPIPLHRVPGLIDHF